MCFVDYPRVTSVTELLRELFFNFLNIFLDDVITKNYVSFTSIVKSQVMLTFRSLGPEQRLRPLH